MGKKRAAKDAGKILEDYVDKAVKLATGGILESQEDDKRVPPSDTTLKSVGSVSTCLPIHVTTGSDAPETSPAAVNPPTTGPEPSPTISIVDNLPNVVPVMPKPSSASGLAAVFIKEAVLMLTKAGIINEEFGLGASRLQPFLASLFAPLVRRKWPRFLLRIRL